MKILRFVLLSLLCFTAFFLVALIVVPAVKTEALEMNRPFGGRILTLLPGIVCPDGVEVFTIIPVVPTMPPGPYYLSAATKRFQYFAAVPMRWILGFYRPVPVTCNTAGIPTPVLKVTMFGTSLF